MPPRPLVALTVPEGLVALAALAAAAWPGAVEAVADAVPYYRYAVLAVGGLLAWRFDRGRVLLALLVVALADRAHGLATDALVPSLAVLAAAPLLAWQSIATEHGVLNRWTGARFAVIAAVALFTLFALGRSMPWPAWLEHHFLPTAWTPLSTVAVGIVLATVAFLVIRFLFDPNPLDQGILWALVTVVAAVHFPAGSPNAQLLFGTAGLILAMATVEDAYGLAYRDELTGLSSRRALERAMKRLGGRYSVAMVDVDRFKRLNDTHGHDVGDQVLRLIATRLRRTSGGGKVYRYGGEEFAILFPGHLAAEVLPHLEAARATVEAASFKVRGPDRPKRRPKKPRARTDVRELAVTVSIGLADSDGDLAAPEEVIKQADQALYRAKKQGRNRVVKNSS